MHALHKNNIPGGQMNMMPGNAGSPASADSPYNNDASQSRPGTGQFAMPGPGPNRGPIPSQQQKNMMPPPSPSVNQAKNGALQGKDGQVDGNGQNSSPRNAGNPHGQPGPQGQPPPGMGPPGPNPTGANTAPPTPGGGSGPSNANVPSSNSMPNMPPPGNQGPSSAPPQMQQPSQDLFAPSDIMPGFGPFDDLGAGMFQGDSMGGLGGGDMPFPNVDFDWFDDPGMLSGDLK